MSIKRDYKPETTWKTRRRVRLQGVLVIALIAVGLLGSLWAYLGGEKRDAANVAARQPPAKETPNTTGVKKPEPVNKSSPKPKYDFYKVLPERQLVIPKDELSTGAPARIQEPPAAVESATASANQRKPSASQARTATRYIIQAGSFRHFADADQRKASIAFLGIQAHIEEGTDKNGRKLHRVRIGPIEDTQRAEALRQRLRKHNINAITLKAD